jgi:hypothetical protein
MKRGLATLIAFLFPFAVNEAYRAVGDLLTFLVCSAAFLAVVVFSLPRWGKQPSIGTRR